MLAGRAALDAIASPARQEFLLALGSGRASVRELAKRLGRSRQALHYHAAVLERAGMIEAVEVRGSGRDREAVYARSSSSLWVNATRARADLDVGKRAGEAMLRLTQREMVRALKEMGDVGGVIPRALFAARGKARLTRAKLARVNALINELLAIFAEPLAARGAPPKLYALTVVLTPSRDASAPNRRRRRRRAR